MNKKEKGKITSYRQVIEEVMAAGTVTGQAVPQDDSKYVITITRQFGSLGRPIAHRLSELLGIEYYDRDIVEAASRKLDLPVSVISDSEETSSGFLKMVFPLGTESISRQQKVFQVQQKIIRELAEKESCIIVGRCSDYILGHDSNAMHIYIYAPYGARFRNCVDVLGMKPEEARKMITDVDKARKFYHKQYAGYAPDNPEYKDLLINSDMLGVDGTARILADIVRARFEKNDRP